METGESKRWTKRRMLIFALLMTVLAAAFVSAEHGEAEAQTVVCSVAAGVPNKWDDSERGWVINGSTWRSCSQPIQWSYTRSQLQRSNTKYGTYTDYGVYEDSWNTSATVIITDWVYCPSNWDYYRTESFFEGYWGNYDSAGDWSSGEGIVCLD